MLKVSNDFGFAVGVLACCSVAACTGRAGEEIQYNRGRIEFALPSAEQTEAVPSYAQSKIAADVRTLRGRLDQAVVIDALKAANEKHAAVQYDQILKLDDRWRDSPPDGPFIAERVDAECSAYMERIVQVMPDLAELFVTDRKGLVVCQSGKTTDYYQADEQWWIDAYAQGKGRAHHGALEFDQSANTYAVSVYLPVTEAGALLGIAKGAVRDVALEEPGVP